MSGTILYLGNPHLVILRGEITLIKNQEISIPDESPLPQLIQDLSKNGRIMGRTRVDEHAEGQKGWVFNNEGHFVSEIISSGIRIAPAVIFLQ